MKTICAGKNNMTTVQKVGAVLRKAGFERSQWIRSRQIRGWGENTTGYRLRMIRDGAVTVEYAHGSATRGARNEQERLSAYGAALISAGLTVVSEDERLVVT
jgi:hypothetical protein